MTTRELAMTTAGVVAVTASVTAGLTTWLLVTAPTTVAMALEGHDAGPIVQAALKTLYNMLARVISYL